MRGILRYIWLLLLLLATPLAAQSIIERLITPGPLSHGHARLESNCANCHTSFRKEAQNSKCTACHSGVGSDIASGTRFHGRFGPARSSACKSCHSEHKGRGFSLIQFNRTGFNHSLTDYPLTGGHVRAPCAGCHGNANNYRGIQRACAACHSRKDPHRGQLGRNCQNCHSTAAWKQVSGFDHNRTGFALTGAHRQQGCMSCHAGQRWKGLGTSCVSCHARDDAHRGSRGTNCASCHTTSAWKNATFDHSMTGFPLTGGHAGASCSGCHGANNANKHPPRACNGCHARDDVHKGQNGANCASCHNPRSWKQTSFDHDRMTEFPLRGAHRNASCESCHKQPPRVAKLPVTCFGCHRDDDAHKGGRGEDCARCHNAASWKSVDFNHNTMTSFPLAGKHAQAKCEACHTRPPKELKLSTDCGSCHAKDDVHKGRLGPACSRCHNSEGWKTEVSFDHALTRFPLLGKHAALQCAGCHADKTFATKGIGCADCHADEHHKGALGTPAACASCHNSTDWKRWSFDHDRQTKFALTGRHKGLICSACHARAGDPAQLGRQCIDCHRRDDIHRGGFGEDCERCHVTSAFREILMQRNR
ncbi:MAG: cytochrome c3 family protein [Novosphingobium sp.]